MLIKNKIIRQITNDPASRLAYYDSVAIYRRTEIKCVAQKFKIEPRQCSLLTFIKKKNKIFADNLNFETLRFYVKLTSLQRYASTECLRDILNHPMYKVKCFKNKNIQNLNKNNEIV